MGYDSTWFAQSPIDGQTPFRRQTKGAYNRTGSATSIGGVYAFDLGWISTLETVANSEGIILPAPSHYKWGRNEYGSAFNNILVPTGGANGGLKLQSTIYCVALGAYADNEYGEYLIVGETTCGALGTASFAYGAWVGLHATSGQTYLTHMDYPTSGWTAQGAYLDNTKMIAVSLGPNTEEGTPAVSNISVFFNGFGLQ